METLSLGCSKLGLELSPNQLEQFEQYYQELTSWNKQFNLTAITEYRDVQTKHFLDSLVGLPLLAEELGESLPFQHPLHIVDVGTGAGFPGIPLKIVAPELKLTLLDGTGKKIKFLEHLTEMLNLQHVRIIQGRAEELGRRADYRGQFDVVTARAVAPLSTLTEYLLPLVRRNGFAMIYKGASAAEEFIEARNAIDILGGEVTRFAPAIVPFLDDKRFVLFIKKPRHTPGHYPRGQGQARKKPLS